jgi:hypothetical protein
MLNYQRDPERIFQIIDSSTYQTKVYSPARLGHEESVTLAIKAGAPIFDG